jgi:hypothetical protein
MRRNFRVRHPFLSFPKYPRTAAPGRELPRDPRTNSPAVNQSLTGQIL